MAPPAHLGNVGRYVCDVILMLLPSPPSPRCPTTPPIILVMKTLCCCPLELSGRRPLTPSQTQARSALTASAGHPTRSQARPLGGHTGPNPRGAYRSFPVPAARTRPECWVHVLDSIV